MKRFAMLICIFLLTPAFAASSKDRSIKGVYLGQPKAELSAEHQAIDCGEVKCWFNETVGGVQTRFGVTLRDGKVASLDITEFSANDFDKVVSAIMTKFGKPGTDEGGTVTNGFGARFDQRTCVWIGKGWQLQARKRALSVDQPVVQYFTSAYAAEINARFAGKKDDI